MQLKSKEKILLIFVIIAIAIWGFDRFYSTPQSRKISKFKEEIKAADLKMDQFLLLTKGVETVETEVTLLEKELKALSERTLKGEEFTAFQYRKVTIQMVLHSTFPKLGSYLKEIEKLPFLVNVDSLQIERNEEILPLLKVTMGLSMHIVS